LESAEDGLIFAILRRLTSREAFFVSRPQLARLLRGAAVKGEVTT
jgi:hypothetical protein